MENTPPLPSRFRSTLEMSLLGLRLDLKGSILPCLEGRIYGRDVPRATAKPILHWYIFWVSLGQGGGFSKTFLVLMVHGYNMVFGIIGGSKDGHFGGSMFWLGNLNPKKRKTPLFRCAYMVIGGSKGGSCRGLHWEILPSRAQRPLPFVGLGGLARM